MVVNSEDRISDRETDKMICIGRADLQQGRECSFFKIIIKSFSEPFNFFFFLNHLTFKNLGACMSWVNI